MTVTFLPDNDVHPRLHNSVEIKPGQLYFLVMLKPRQATWQMSLRFNKFFKLLGSWCSSFQCHHREQEINVWVKNSSSSWRQGRSHVWLCVGGTQKPFSEQEKAPGLYFRPFSKHDCEQNESFGAAWQPRAA